MQVRAYRREVLTMSCWMWLPAMVQFLLSPWWSVMAAGAAAQYSRHSHAWKMAVYKNNECQHTDKAHFDTSHHHLHHIIHRSSYAALYPSRRDTRRACVACSIRPNRNDRALRSGERDSFTQREYYERRVHENRYRYCIRRLRVTKFWFHKT